MSIFDNKKKVSLRKEQEVKWEIMGKEGGFCIAGLTSKTKNVSSSYEQKRNVRGKDLYQILKEKHKEALIVV